MSRHNYPDNKDQPHISVVGMGYWGKHLVRNYNQLGALKLVCDPNRDLIAKFKGSYPGVEFCQAFNEVLARDSIQGVVIATPVETHYSLATEALLAGKHVYVEKPLVLKVSQAEALIALADKKQLTLMVGHLLQYHPVFIQLRKLVQSGELGRISYIYSHRLNLGKIRRQENILWSFAPHDISMILALTGEQPVSVMATGGNYLHQNIADVTTTHLTFASGIRAHVFVSWLHPFKEQKLVVVGDRKMAVFNDTLKWNDKLLLYPHQIKWQNQVPVPDRADPERPLIDPAEPLQMECRHFLHCIRSGEEPQTDGHEGLRVLRVLKAGQKSLNQNSHPITLLADNNSGSDQGPPPQIHETAVVDANCRVASGTRIWHFSHIQTGARIGRDCNIGQNVVIGPDVTIGDRCKVQNNVSVYQGVTLEEGVFCGPSMVFTNVDTPRAEIHKMDQLKTTLVRRGATIGANATVVCGLTIGCYAFVGAGSVVTRDIPDHALVAGNPARWMGWICGCGERLSDELQCPVCGNQYRKNNEGLIRECGSA